MKEKDQKQKTNVMRLLDQKGIFYQAHSYPHGEGAVDGVTVAALLGLPPCRVFKTLVAVGASKRYYVFDLPAERELDLKKAAKAVGEKSVALIPVSQLLPLTGYIRGGCSPIGMKKLFPTVLDASALDFETICVSGGKIGVQVELSPRDLLSLVDGSAAEITDTDTGTGK